MSSSPVAFSMSSPLPRILLAVFRCYLRSLRIPRRCASAYVLGFGGSSSIRSCHRSHTRWGTYDAPRTVSSSPRRGPLISETCWINAAVHPVPSGPGAAARVPRRHGGEHPKAKLAVRRTTSKLSLWSPLQPSNRRTLPLRALEVEYCRRRECPGAGRLKAKGSRHMLDEGCVKMLLSSGPHRRRPSRRLALPLHGRLSAKKLEQPTRCPCRSCSCAHVPKRFRVRNLEHRQPHPKPLPFAHGEHDTCLACTCLHYALPLNVEGAVEDVTYRASLRHTSGWERGVELNGGATKTETGRVEGRKRRRWRTDGGRKR
ncbi:hypothetical protein B0H14DRAFT_1208078 [Mycena olivaceomarginata]|nr:hypothetical protein B0H14DRAFT_1208078 [Mycena olivaceomarginata]